METDPLIIIVFGVYLIAGLIIGQILGHWLALVI